jgi:GNAT superfamily N-acetyltransferase
MASPTIRAATAAEEATVVSVLTLAFSTDPVARWMYPDPRQYLAHFPAFTLAFGGRGVAWGSAYLIDGFAGAALWLPPDEHPDEEQLNALIERTVGLGEQRDLVAMFEQMGSYHPQEPHWYLPLIGVEAIHQGHGYGSALMEHALRVCDQTRTLAYLESSNPRNVSLYLRHGFEILGTIQAGTAPPLTPMLRKPR